MKIKNSKHFTSLFRQWNEQTAHEEIFPKSPKPLLYDAQFMMHLFLYKNYCPNTLNSPFMMKHNMSLLGHQPVIKL